MTEYREENYLMLSGIQHFAFCRRQWALIHVEQQWAENEYTVAGEILHQNAHDPYRYEKRKDVLISRALPVVSRQMGVSGECDIVEFRKAEDGVTLHGHRGLYQIYPVEYKKGKPKSTPVDVLQLTGECDIVEFRKAEDGVTLHGHRGLYQIYPVEYKKGKPKSTPVDVLQLTAQAMCLEEMFCTSIPEGAIYYGETKRRETVAFTDEGKQAVKAAFGRNVLHIHPGRGHLLWRNEAQGNSGIYG